MARPPPSAAEPKDGAQGSAAAGPQGPTGSTSSAVGRSTTTCCATATVVGSSARSRTSGCATRRVARPPAAPRRGPALPRRPTDRARPVPAACLWPGVPPAGTGSSDTARRPRPSPGDPGSACDSGPPRFLPLASRAAAPHLPRAAAGPFAEAQPPAPAPDALRARVEPDPLVLALASPGR